MLLPCTLRATVLRESRPHIPVGSACMGLEFWWRSELITSLLWVTHTLYRSILAGGIDLRSLPPEIGPFWALVPF